jgi:glycosyltransferase involved in cell wall biosynthesis
MTVRVAVFLNALSPYRVELFNVVADIADVELKVFTCAVTEPGRHWSAFENARFEHEVVPGIAWGRWNWQTRHFNPRAVIRIARWRPDVVVGGMTTMIGLLGYAASWYARCGFAWWLDVTEGADASLSTPLLAGAKHFLATHADSAVASSSLARDYALSLGAQPDRLFVSLLTVDTRSLAHHVDEERPNARDLKSQLGLTGAVIGYFGQLEAHKGITHMIEAARLLRTRTPAPTLLFVGTGSLLAEAQQSCKDAGLEAVFAGFQQPAALPKYYAICDVFWLLSDIDCFGVVAVEAAAAGLPLLVSRFAGASGDMVRDDVNGWVVDPSDAARVARLVDDLLDDDGKRAAFGGASREIALALGIEVARDGFMQAVEAAGIESGGVGRGARGSRRDSVS